MSTNKTDTPMPTGADALAVLSQLRRGQTAADISEALHELVAAVRATGKKGALTIKLTVAPHSKGDDTILTLTDDVTLKTPRAERGASIFYATVDNALVRNDPRQAEMRFDVIEGNRADAARRVN